VIPVAYHGRSRFHTTSAANIAGLVLLCAGLPGQRVLNIADPAAPTVSEIANCITGHFCYTGRILELPDVEVYPPPFGRTPWSVQHRFVLDIAAATALGYRPRVLYHETVAKVCDWLVYATAGRDWRALLPTLASYPYDLFDYASEDAALATVS
jgi:nucleoside-diphosphate-sugar epimerase